MATLFKNNVDFYFSFTIGVSAAVCIAGFWQVFAGLRKKREKNLKMQGIRLEQEDTSVPEGRGDIPFSLGITVYLALTTFVIILSGYLIDWHPGVMIVLFILGYFYTPLISYVTARLEGMAGQVVQVPMIREICLILSGYQGVAIWFLPMPLGNYGQMTMFYRRCELLGTKFTSVWKAMVFLYPIILISSILFANFIWHIAEVPSAMYPYAQVMWPLNAEMQSIMFSATMGEYSQFEEALNFAYIGWGTFFGVGLFAVLSYLGAPIFLVYGVVRGLGQTLPHAVLGQFFGALLGHFYFRKQFGKMWRKYIPVIGAGFACGMGLINVFGIGIVFLNKSVVQLLY